MRIAHCYNIRRATNTPVTIHHADGETTVRINQQETPPHERLFRSLGTFRFQVGRAGWVRISTDGTDGKYVIADAVQWLPVKSEVSFGDRRRLMQACGPTTSHSKKCRARQKQVLLRKPELPSGALLLGRLIAETILHESRMPEVAHSPGC